MKKSIKIFCMLFAVLTATFAIASCGECEHENTRTVRENKIAATCTTDGSYDEVVICNECEEELSRTRKSVSATGHREVSHNAKAPSCTQVGWNAYVTCENCDYTTYTELHALGHNYENYICTVCDDVIIPSVGLKYYLSSDRNYYIVSGIGTCTDTELVIPHMYENLPVVSIGSSAFSGCTSLTSIKYCGTEEEWDAISKGSHWDIDIDSCTIIYNYTGE